jgi:hypothetical protein
VSARVVRRALGDGAVDRGAEALDRCRIEQARDAHEAVATKRFHQIRHVAHDTLVPENLTIGV